MSKQYLFEILIPTTDNTKDRVKYAPSFHQEWDAKVRAISGGLTIIGDVRGQWISPREGLLFQDTMIAVRIMCRASQMFLIARMTIKHYDQEAVMYYRIADMVTMLNKREVGL